MQNDTVIFRLLGAMFYHSPSSESVRTILESFSSQNDELLHQLAMLAQSTDIDLLETDFFKLLQGNGDMPCPPWGSAYLDNENALFGHSTLEYRAFIKALGMQCETGMREPEDHIGLMLMMLSILLERNDKPSADLLLAKHLMPFAPIMLEEMSKHADTDFYKGLALFSLGWLNMYCEEQSIEIESRRCYWESVKL